MHEFPCSSHSVVPSLLCAQLATILLACQPVSIGFVVAASSLFLPKSIYLVAMLNLAYFRTEYQYFIIECVTSVDYCPVTAK